MGFIKYTILRISVISGLIFILTLNADASQRINVAVFAIKPINCNAEIGRAVEEIIISELFNTSLFALMEKSQIDRIAKKNGFTDFDITDNSLMQKIGHQLKVDKIIVGSISHVSNYRIELRSIDIKSGKIDIAKTAEAQSETELEAAVIDTVKAIERFYLGYDRLSGKFDISAAPSIIIPLKNLNEGINYGKGLVINTYFNRVFADNISFLASFGAYTTDCTKERTRSAFLFPASLGLSYNTQITKTLTMQNSLNAGVLYSRLDYDVDGYKTDGKYTYQKRNLYNLLLSARCEFSVFIHNRLLFIVAPQITVLPEKENTVLYYEIQVGPKIMF